MSEQTSITKAALLPEEDQYLASVLQDLTNTSALGIYADWLEDQGDEDRSLFVRSYSQSLQSGSDFPEPADFPIAWLDIIGYRIAKACCENSLADERFHLLKLAQPALKFDEESDYPDDLQEDTFPVGASKRFGLPDLPEGTAWPRQKDCTATYDPESGIEPETPCGFVAQINCQDLEGTLLGQHFPSHGLISIFACGEFEEIGMYDGLVTFTPDTSTLVRMEAPAELIGDEADEANRLAEPEAFQFTECLELPDPGAESCFEQIRWGYDDPRSDHFEKVREAVDQQSLHSIGGFTQATSGDDPFPDQDWCKLIAIQAATESRFHFCIKKDALKAGDFSNTNLVWIDFD